MLKTHNHLRPAIVYHPGETLEEVLLNRKISQSDFAKIIGKSPKIINEIIKGKRSITPAIAFLFSIALENISAEFWLGLQKKYDLYCLRLKDDRKKEEKKVKERLKLYQYHHRWVTDSSLTT